MSAVPNETGQDDNVLDAHLHLWDRARFDYPWMAGRADLPERSLPGEPGFPALAVSADAAGQAPAGAVFVEAGVAPDQCLDEVAWVAERAEQIGIRGIVAAVDLSDPAALRRDLDSLADVPLVVGVRDNFEGLPAGALAGRLPGALVVLAAGLRIDVCIRGGQVDELHEWLSAIVRERGSAAGIVLDHIAKPGLAELGGSGEHGEATLAESEVIIARARGAWLPGLRRLAGVTDLSVKFSGLPGQVTGPAAAEVATLLAQAFGPEILDAFGPERVLFGSDHPVSTVAHELGYDAWLGAVRDVLDAHVSPHEKAAVLGGNAARFYGIGNPIQAGGAL